MLAGTVSAQTAATGTVRGSVVDQDTAIIPGATVVLLPVSGASITAKAGSDGTFRVPAPAGTYTVTVTMPGFANFSKAGVKVVAGQSVTVDAKMAVGEQTEIVNVTTNATTLSVDQDSNASSTVIKGKDLEALSDDPDELSSELSALAGPSAGPNGGQIYVDGFTGGQLPPKSSIREIRVNQNPFSAQFDRLGYGRVEVFTKPGTDKFHGNFNINGNPSQFNSGNPLTATAQPPYHTIFTQGNITGPVSKISSFSIGGSYRNIQDNTIVNAAIPTTSATSQTLCAPGQSGCVLSTFQIATPFPQVRWEITPRFDLAVSEKNTLTVRYQQSHNESTNDGIGGLELPTAAYNSKSGNEELQISDTQTLSSRLINETRFEYERQRDSTTALTNAPSLSVTGSFSAGGAGSQNATVHESNFEVQNYTSLALAKNFIRFGGRLRTRHEAENSQNGTNGSFTYNTIANYQAGHVDEFSITRLNVPTVRATFADLGLYAEDDWKVRPNFTLSYGVRFETQNNISDHADIAPRISFAYGVGSAKGTPKIVLRGGFGMFYDRFGIGNVLNLARQNGTVTTTFTTTAPSAACSPNTTASITACTSGASAASTTTYTKDPNLRTPYTMQFAFGADKQLWKLGTLSVNYLHARGVHQLASQNASYPLTGTPAPGAPVLYQYFTEGVFNQNQLVVNANVRYSRWLTLFGYYALNFAQGDTSGGFITVPHNIAADYGRTAFSVRNRLFMAGSISLPRNIQISPFMVAQSGNPYNVTIGSDLNKDTLRNERPMFAIPGAPVDPTATTKTIPGCGTFTTPPQGTLNYTPVPINYCTGPALFTLNFRATKTFGFGASTTRPASGGSDGGRGGPGGGGDHGRGGGGGRGGPGGGMGGMFGGGGGGTGKRYNLGFGVIVQNVFANNDYATPNGTLLSPLFGQSTQLSGGPYSTNAALRRIALSTTFNF